MTLGCMKNLSKTKCPDLARIALWRKEVEIRNMWKERTIAQIWTWFSKVMKLHSRSRSLAQINALVSIWIIRQREGMNWRQKLKSKQTLACRTYLTLKQSRRAAKGIPGAEHSNWRRRKQSEYQRMISTRRSEQRGPSITTKSYIRWCLAYCSVCSFSQRGVHSTTFIVINIQSTMENRIYCTCSISISLMIKTSTSSKTSWSKCVRSLLRLLAKDCSNSCALNCLIWDYTMTAKTGGNWQLEPMVPYMSARRTLSSQARWLSNRWICQMTSTTDAFSTTSSRR